MGLGFGSRGRVGPGCLSPRYEPEQRENEQDEAVARHLDAHELRQRGEAREVEAVSWLGLGLGLGLGFGLEVRVRVRVRVRV